MAITFRQGVAADAAACGRICFEAFAQIADAHNFPREFPALEVSVAVLSMMLTHPGYYVVVAERDGEIIGSNALDERSLIAGIGPISTSPTVQDCGVGRELMRRVLERAHSRGFPGVRLVQAAYHNRSLALYAKLGFEPREPLSCVQGSALNTTIAGYAVRPAVEGDLEACNQLGFRVHGHTRAGDLRDAVAHGTATVVERDGRVTGYASVIAFYGHAVGETNDDLQALIAAAPAFGGPGFLLPTRNGNLLRWCLGRGLRVVQAMTLMTIGLYNEPRGAYLPSVSY